MKFTLDAALANSTIELANWPLCKVLFKNESQFAWFLLVPKRQDVTEIYQLDKSDQAQLTHEINQLSALIKDYFKPDKLNLAAIGNQVPQLHIHVVGRFKTDSLWPESIWQAKYQAQMYKDIELKKVINDLKAHKLVLIPDSK